MWFRRKVRITLLLGAASTRGRSSLRIGIEQRGVHGFYPTRVRGGIELQRPLSFDTCIRLMALRKYNRRRKSTQDGRELTRYCRRWKVERPSLGFTTSPALSSAGKITKLISLSCSSLAASSR